MPEGTRPGVTVADQGLSIRLAAAAPIPLDLTLEVAPGEVLALVGPSGAGKSTVLRSIAGLYRPTRGVVRCGGATWLDTAAGIDVPPHRRAAGLVFQDYALFPHMTALGNVAAAMGHRPRAGRDAHARALLARVQLTGLEERRPAELSGGQQQRVAVARALARDPAILLLDEPFGAVDRATRRRLQAELAMLRRDLSIPVILVTHDLDEALALADRMCLVRRGRGLQTAPPAEMLARPASGEVARLLDLRNLFRGVVERHDAAAGTTWLRWGDRVLAAAHAPGFGAGDPVEWLVSGSAIAVRGSDAPMPEQPGNAIVARVADLLALGEEARVTLDVADPDDGPLIVTMPLRAARRLHLAPGEACTVSLQREGIHAMPAGDT